jgi:hypothetical protein
MPDANDEIPRAARRQNLRRRRRTRRVVSGIAVAVVVVALGALAFDFVRVPGGSTPAVAAKVGATGTSTTDPNAITIPTNGEPPRAITVDNPMRLWIGGDSLAGSLGPSLGDIAAKTGVVQPQFDSRVSSGLESPSFFDWPQHATQEMSRLNPEVVVFIIGANDYSSVPSADNPTALADFKSNYAQLVGKMIDAFGPSSTRTIYWVGAPIMKDDKMTAGVKVVDEVARTEIAKHTHVAFFDSFKLFADSTGKYMKSMTDPTSSKTVTLRAGDGVHFTPDGGDYLANALYKLLDAQWHITQQTVPGHVKNVRETQGSEQVAGTSRHITGATAVPRNETTATYSSPTQSTTQQTTQTTVGAVQTTTTTAPKSTTTATSPAVTTTSHA